VRESMWPYDPDEFESLVTPPAGANHDDAWYFPYIDQQILCVSEHGSVRPIDADAFRWLQIEVDAEIYLGHYRGRSCFAVAARGSSQEGFALMDLRGWLGRVDASLFYLAGRAKQLVDWHLDHAFCGRCGAAMEDHPQDRARTCGRCSLISYPRLSPSIIVLIRRGQDMLLARNARWPTGMFSTLAGFVEPGESIEQTVHREVMEEVGLKVTRLRYLGSQSWPFPNSLMLGFHADYAGGEILCQEREISEARWFPHDDLPDVPPGTAISRWLIDAFIEDQRSPAANH